MAKTSGKNNPSQKKDTKSTVGEASPPDLKTKVGQAIRRTAEAAFGMSLGDAKLEGKIVPVENTRSRLATYFVWGYFLTIFITLYIGYNKNFTINDYKDILLTVSGVLTGSLGFIMGYYFKIDK